MPTKETTASGSHLGPVSLAVYAHDLEPEQAAQTLVQQATTALNEGVHGVTISEHHAGFNGYVPCPSLLATAILGATTRGWVAPSPLLLPLRPVPLVMEEMAWLSGIYPGRVAAGVAAGYSERDFAVFGLDRATANRSFREKLNEWHGYLTDEDGSALLDDPAVAGLLPRTPILVCTGGPKTSAFAARRGFGLMLPPQDPGKNRDAAENYRATGGNGPRLAGQWVWLGDPPAEGVDALARAYADTDASGNRMYSPGVVHDTDPDALAQRLLKHMDDLNLTGINLRVHLPGVGADTTTEQIRTIAQELVPRIETALTSRVRS